MADSKIGKLIRNSSIHSSLSFLLFILTVVPTTAQVTLSQQNAEVVFRKANELMDLGSYAAARISFKEFLSIAASNDGRKSEAYYGVASAALHIQHKDGEALMQQFIAQNNGHPKQPIAQAELANSYYQKQEYTKAIQQYNSISFALLSYQDQMRAKFQLGYSYFSDRKLTEALLHFNDVKSGTHAYTAAANYYAGFVEYSQSAYDEALIDLQKAELTESYRAVVPYLIASVYYRQGKFNELLAYAEKVRELEGVKNLKEIQLLVAEAHYAKGDYEKAASAYNESLQDKATADAGIWYRAGLSNYKTGRKSAAIPLLEQAAVTSDEVAPVASYQLGIVYIESNQKLFALNAFDRARKAKDMGIVEQAQFNFAKIAYDEGQSDKAITEFEKYLSQFPTGLYATETKELLAQAYVNGNNYNKAIQYIEALSQKSAVVEQAYQKATFLKGVEYYNKNQYDEAFGYFTKSLSYPRDVNYVQRATFWCGEIQSMQKKYSAAEAFYEKSLSATGNDKILRLQSRYAAGYAYYNQKKFNDALVYFKEFVTQATKQTTNYADGVLRLADCYYVTKEYQTAIIRYNEFKKFAATDMDYAYLQTGMIHGLLRNYSESRTQFNLLISSFPSSPYRAEAIYQQAQFDIEQGNYQNSVDGLTQLIKTEPTSVYIPHAYARRAASYFNLKNYSQTVNDYVMVVKQYSSSPLAQEVLLPLQEALELSGQSGQFDQYLAAVKKANPDNKGLENLEFETAKKTYFNEQYEKAIVSLTGFIQTYSQSTFVNEAIYYQAESNYRLRQYAQALPYYQKLKAVTSFSFAPRVAARIGECYFKLTQFQEAIAGYHYFETYAVAKKDQYTAFSGLMESFYLLAQYDSSDFYARKILDGFAINAGAENRASLYLGKSAMTRGDYEVAEDEFLNTLNTARDEYGAEAKYLLATIFYLNKDYKQCRETLFGLNKDFATYESWVGKSYLLLVDNYLAEKDIYQAKATLQSLVDNFPIEGIRNEAAQRLKAIEQQQAQAIANDTLQVDKQ